MAIDVYWHGRLTTGVWSRCQPMTLTVIRVLIRISKFESCVTSWISHSASRWRSHRNQIEEPKIQEHIRSKRRCADVGKKEKKEKHCRKPKDRRKGTQRHIVAKPSWKKKRNVIVTKPRLEKSNNAAYKWLDWSRSIVREDALWKDIEIWD